MKDFNDEIPKYKKKKNKTVKKSNHKHEYKQCLLYVDEIEDYVLADYCIHCNKIYNMYVISEKVEGSNFERGLTKQEKLKKYKNLTVKRVGKLSEIGRASCRERV